MRALCGAVLLGMGLTVQAYAGAPSALVRVGAETSEAAEVGHAELQVLDERIRKVRLELTRTRAVARGEASVVYLNTGTWPGREAAGRPVGEGARVDPAAGASGVMRRASDWLERAQARLQRIAEGHEGEEGARRHWSVRTPAAEVHPRSARLEAELRVLEVERDLLAAALRLQEEAGDRAALQGAWSAARAARARLEAEAEDPSESVTRATATARTP